MFLHGWLKMSVSATNDKLAMQQLTKEQAIVLTGFTGILMVQNTSDFHEDVERRLGRPVFTHEFADPHGEIKEAYRADFEKLIGQLPK